MSFRAIDLLGNSQRLDGGAMFGNAPKALWERWLSADDANRVPLACRALLIDTDQHKVLLETGIGCFFEPELRERYGVVESEHILLASLSEHGLSDEDIDCVILSHLHFDHAGGLLKQYQAGRDAELLFPNARFLTSRTAFERAKAPHPRDRASFIPALPLLLEQSGRLTLLEDRQEQDAELGPRFHFRQSHGHTPGMLHTLIEGSQHRLFFCADLVPGRPWVHLPITMGYDRCAETLIDEKTAWLPQFAEDGTWLFFTHDPGCAAARIAPGGKGKLGPTEIRERFGSGWNLDVA